MKRNSLRTNEEETGSIGIGAMIVFIALILVAAVASAVIIQTGEKLQQNAQQTGDDTQEEIGGKISIITSWIGDQSDCDNDEDDTILDDLADPANDNPDDDDKCITLVYELAAGSEPIDEKNVVWTIICTNNAGTAMETIYGTFDGVANNAFDQDTDNDGGAVSANEQRAAGAWGTTWMNGDTMNVDGSHKGTVNVAGNTFFDEDTLLPGEVYMIDLKVENDVDANAVQAAGDGNDDVNGNKMECAPAIGEEHTLVISVEGGGTTYETLSYSSVTEGDSIV
jgi:archaellin